LTYGKVVSSMTGWNKAVPQFPQRWQGMRLLLGAFILQRGLA
jgi:hypothetical protein